MQRAYLSKLMELCEQDSNVLHLVADSGTGYDEMLRRSFPDRMINFGIAEEHMVAAAAGLATAGKIPFVYTAGAFLAYRALEFVRDDICFQNQNVKVVGMGSGLSWCSLGPTHHTTEDVAVLRAIPNLMILSPATPVQVSACVERAYAHQGPVYIRIGMSNETEFFEEGYALAKSGVDVFSPGGDVVIVSTGSILEEVMQAAQLLRKQGVTVTILNVVCIKPFDPKPLFQALSGAKLPVTVEEHNIIGGLGSIVSEALCDAGMGRKLLRIGLNDCFAGGYGKTQAAVRRENGLDAESIARIIGGALYE